MIRAGVDQGAAVNHRSWGAFVLGVSTALGLLPAALVLSAGPAAAATCPSVDPSTGAVSPAPGPGTQWPGCDLSGADLSGADLSGANLSGASLQSANISGANLTQTDLMNSDLTGANLTGADLMETMLDNTVLASATLTGVSSDLISGTPASLPSNWILVSNYLAGPGADLADANLTGASLANADLSSANLTDAKLAQTTLTGTDLTDATLTGVSSGRITGTPGAFPLDWSLHNGYLVGPGASLYLADLSSQDLSGLTLTGIDLSSASLKNSDLSGTDLTAAILNGTNLTGADMTGATLAQVQSLSIQGIPSALPANWLLQGGYLLGPGADLHGATLNSFQLKGADLSGADLSSAYLVSVDLANADLANADLASSWVDNATLTGASFRDAKLTGTVLSSSRLAGADLSGADLTSAGVADANLTSANFSGATLTGTDFDYSNLTRASLDQASVSGATFLGVVWSHTTCPDGSNSDKHVKGCFSALDTTPPVVAVTGVSNGHSYVFGAVPAPGCRTTDNGTVSKPAVLTLTTSGSNGVGAFTATCSGAVDLAGNRQKVPVEASYTVLYGMHGFLAPASGTTIARSSRVITVLFRLTDASGTPIPSARAAALAAARHVRATLRGPGISAVTVVCGWNATHRYFACAIRIPAGIRTGAHWQYILTAGENAGTGFVSVPGVRGAVDPEVIHFR